MISKKKLALVLFSLVISIFLLEIGVRIFLPATPLHTGYTLNSDHLVDQALHLAREKQPNEPVPLRIKTGRDYQLSTPEINSREKFLRMEAERWGNPETNKTKILVIGDSHTQNINNYDPGWTDYLEKEFQDTELFSLGLGGAGATQEYILLNQSIDIIDPDIVLWQFCHNDYQNDNYQYSLDMWPFIGNSIEPYPTRNTLQYRMPSPLSELRRHSKSIDFALAKLQILAAESSEGSRIRELLMEHFYEHPPRNYSKTEPMVERAINRTREKGAEFYIITVNGPPTTRQNYTICNHVNATCIKRMDRYTVKKEKEFNWSLYRDDGHWNAKGNKIAGKFLAKYFRDHSLL